MDCYTIDMVIFISFYALVSTTRLCYIFTTCCIERDELYKKIAIRDMAIQMKKHSVSRMWHFTKMAVYQNTLLVAYGTLQR